MSSSKLQSQVIEFMQLFDQKIEPEPSIPDPKTVRLRVMLVLEEALEFLEACFGSLPEKMIVEEMIRERINRREPKVSLEKVADALGDLDYVSEGARLAFGLDGESIADEIHRTNLLKVGGRVREGKQLKPLQWEPPKIEEILAKQNSKELPTVGDRLMALKPEAEVATEEVRS